MKWDTPYGTVGSGLGVRIVLVPMITSTHMLCFIHESSNGPAAHYGPLGLLWAKGGSLYPLLIWRGQTVLNDWSGVLESFLCC